jgi:hypothetical protein
VSGSGTAPATAEKKQGAHPAQPVGSACHSCGAAKETEQAFWVELRVRTRLGDHAVQGVHGKVAGESFGRSDAEGGFGSGAAVKRKRYEKDQLTVEGHYENPTEKLKKETFSVELSKIDPEQRRLEGTVRQRIAKVEDVGGGMRDFDFASEYPISAHPDEAEWLPAAQGTNGEPILRVTVRLATFSLAVGYLNQNLKSETVRTHAKDPENATHPVEKTYGKKNGWDGSVLCSPTSGTMLADYWSKRLNGKGLFEEHGPGGARARVMQRYYDQWAEEGFPGRFDTRVTVPPAGGPPAAAGPTEVLGELFPVPAGGAHPPAWRMVAQPRPPAAPAEDAFWLDTSKEPHQLYRCDYLFKWHELIPDEVDLEQVLVDPGEPAQPRAGSFWRPQSLQGALLRDIVWLGQAREVTDQQLDPLVFEWRASQYEWDPVDEGWWRVAERREWTVAGKPDHVEARVWQFHDRTGKAVSSLLPGAPPAATGLGFRIGGKAPLSRVLSGDTYRTNKGSKKKPNWVDEPLDARPLANYLQWLGKGWPFVVGTDATSSGHVMLVRGAVVDHEDQVHWLILNDPYGNLASEGTIAMDLEVGRPVGGGVANRAADVEKVQRALQAAGRWDRAIDGLCGGTDEDPLVAALRSYQTEVMKLSAKWATGLASPGQATAKRLEVELELPVGRKDAEAVNDPADVIAVKQALEALGYYGDSGGPPGEVDAALIKGIADFQAANLKSVAAPDAKGHIGLTPGQGSRRAGGTLRKLLEKVAGEGYTAKKEQEINKSGTNTGEGERGRHVYYRNTTRGANRCLRIGPDSCARIEAQLSPEQIAAGLVPGS